MKKIVILFAALIFITVGCEKDAIEDPVYPEYTIPQISDSVKTNFWVPDLSVLENDSFIFEFADADNNIYHAIQIGNQIWSKENLKTTHYNDNTPIPCIQGKFLWAGLKKGAYCHYENDTYLSDIYGLLYNYYAVATNKLAPKGWHVATIEDWNTLMVEIGNNPFPTIGDVGVLVDQRCWPHPFYSIFDLPVLCTNSTLFSALPNGYRDYFISPDYDCLGGLASWWAFNQSGEGKIILLDGVFGIYDEDGRPKHTGSGIRLVKDAE